VKFKIIKTEEARNKAKKWLLNCRDKRFNPTSGVRVRYVMPSLKPPISQD